ncbi:class I SAM-dependent rRNA methyltransferase [Winogradskyella aurantiaca]|uniref:class I SAM-dependent rRNA methyltransferase n=1 Tax=Winogradskyella aurantiaca TaxID=2219558 RepID=UPI000E1DC9A9|nr:class I SAM-dependent rRNA methyltransferase [Winogradskyella aurantiaca]
MKSFQSFTIYQPKRLAVKLSAKGEQYVLKGHPWIFSNSIQKINKPPETGDLAVIFRKSGNKFIGIGLYDKDSDIRIKMLYNGSESKQIDAEFFKDQVQKAYSKRHPLLETDTNSYRLLFGESDGFPGLIADVYDKVLVVKFYSGIWFPYFSDFLDSLIEITECKTVVLRLSRKLQQSDRHNLNDGMIVYGELEDEIVVFREHGVRFSANVIKGHKTGYFLDHRDNRKRVGEMSRGKTVLDVFSYSGGFSVHALANGAKEVKSIDISAQALEVAQFNASLNAHEGKHHTLAGDAFEILNQMIEQKISYDLVVIDPPSFAKQQSEVNLAKKKYAQLAKLGAQLTKANGILVLASCSSRVSKDVFVETSLNAILKTGRTYKIIKTTTHDVDHPIGFAEAAYLKSIYLQLP